MKGFKTKLLFLILALFVTSCTSGGHRGQARVDLAGVSLDSNDKSNIPHIGVSGHDSSFGPSPTEENLITLKKKLDPVLAINFGPGLNRAIGYVSVLKNLERYSIQPRIVSGAGMGAVVASLYANGSTPEHIEWKLFKLFAKLKGKRALTNEWKLEVSKFLKKEFGKKQIQSTKLTLHIPVYDKKMRKLRYISRGNLYNKLYANFIFSASGKRRYLSPLKVQSYDPSELRKKGADVIVAYDVLSDEISFKEKSDYIFGIYAKASGFVKRIVGHERHMQLDINEMPLDTNEDLQKYIHKSLVSSEEFTQKLKKDLKEWNPSDNSEADWDLEE